MNTHLDQFTAPAFSRQQPRRPSGGIRWISTASGSERDPTWGALATARGTDPHWRLSLPYIDLQSDLKKAAGLNEPAAVGFIEFLWGSANLACAARIG